MPKPELTKKLLADTLIQLAVIRAYSYTLDQFNYRYLPRYGSRHGRGLGGQHEAAATGF